MYFLLLFQNALKTQELSFKGTRATIEGTKQDIVTCQEKHDHLTTISRRAQRLCASRKASIKKNKDLIEETKLDLAAGMNRIRIYACPLF